MAESIKDKAKASDKKRAGTPKRKASHAKACRKYRETHPETDRDYYLANQADIKARATAYYRKVNMQRKYGLTLEGYKQLLINQDNRCAICGNHFGRACVDHDHETGEVRGLICGNCNTGIGMFKDNITLLNNAIKYLEKFHD